MSKIAILLDSSIEMSEKESNELGINIIRMPLTVNGEEFIEEVDITRDTLIKKMREGKIVKTSQPTMGSLVGTIDGLLETYDQVIFIPISSELSGTYNTGMSLAKDYDGRLIVIDALLVSAPLKQLAVEIKELIEEGMSGEEIRDLVEDKAFMYASLIPEDIVYLKRGGRISPAAAAVANLLKIVPVLSVTDGKIDLVEKVRTHKKAVKVGIEKAFEGRDPQEYGWFIVDGDCDPKVLKDVISDVEKKLGYTPEVRKHYPIILAHTGPGTIAVCAYKKIK